MNIIQDFVAVLIWTSILKDGPFNWPKSVQGAILASYFIGYAITEVQMKQFYFWSQYSKIAVLDTRRVFHDQIRS